MTAGPAARATRPTIANARALIPVAPVCWRTCRHSVTQLAAAAKTARPQFVTLRLACLQLPSRGTVDERQRTILADATGRNIGIAAPQPREHRGLVLTGDQPEY